MTKQYRPKGSNRGAFCLIYTIVIIIAGATGVWLITS